MSFWGRLSARRTVAPLYARRPMPLEGVIGLYLGLVLPERADDSNRLQSPFHGDLEEAARDFVHRVRPPPETWKNNWGS